MAQFDVYSADGVYLIDCQSDLLAGLSTRLVVPLFERPTAPKPADRLNPVFDIDGRSYVMMTQYLATVPMRVMGSPVASLSHRYLEITGAIDFLMSGA